MKKHSSCFRVALDSKIDPSSQKPSSNKPPSLSRSPKKKLTTMKKSFFYAHSVPLVLLVTYGFKLLFLGALFEFVSSLKASSFVTLETNFFYSLEEDKDFLPFDEETRRFFLSYGEGKKSQDRQWIGSLILAMKEKAPLLVSVLPLFSVDFLRSIVNKTDISWFIDYLVSLGPLEKKIDDIKKSFSLLKKYENNEKIFQDLKTFFLDAKKRKNILQWKGDSLDDFVHFLFSLKERL